MSNKNKIKFQYRKNNDFTIILVKKKNYLKKGFKAFEDKASKMFSYDFFNNYKLDIVETICVGKHICFQCAIIEHSS